MERIDPDAVEVPAWYTANPHRAGDIAFVLFTGEGAGTKAIQISNKRWALSALGTASAAALRSGDTVYSTTPFHHSSALLMSVGGAVAGGARFAMATDDDPETFWDEVRRYGASHVSYTWTSLRAHHLRARSTRTSGSTRSGCSSAPACRATCGAGWPSGSRTPGCSSSTHRPRARRSSPTSPASGPARWDARCRAPPRSASPRTTSPTRRLKLTSDGLARECLTDEVGLMLTRVSSADPGGGATIMRSVFATDDAWRSTGDLFLRDDQGDHWLAGSVSEIVDTARGPVLPAGTRFCLGTIPAVDLLVAYGVKDGDERVVVGAVTLLDGAELSTADLDSAMDRLPRRHRPRYVQVVASIPLTTWSRPIWRNLQKRGVPKPARGRRVWRIDDETGHYTELT